MYRHNDDPWQFASSAYELGRYDAIMDALGRRQYRMAFEPGCSIGVLTERLAMQCDCVVASDLSPTAVRIAKERCSHLAHVRILCAPVTEDLRVDDIDLLVLSEIGYYFDREQWRIVAQGLIENVSTSGTILASHWLGHSDDHLQSGDSVHEMLLTIDGLALDQSERHPGFRLDRWRKL
ncbi:nodulation S family protein [Acidicapsa ligni]|uniref:nodulation S family protein n=1 Tax=Acidicapsa ligni TaxID=542300 RepID=UPI0021E0DE6C|nr:nodulation S family protein [Acidicapsa ligni]